MPEQEGIYYEDAEPFSYAEQFNAPSWLEVPAQALWFAMQSRINGDLPGAVSWLRQFWSKLEEVKRGATDATWPEILALDAQSQIQGANITTAIINTMTGDASTASALMGPFGWKGTDAREAIAQAQQLRAQMLAQAETMAAQARTAQAERIQAVVDGRISQDDAEAAHENKLLENIIRDNSSFTLGGLPAWAYIAGGLGLLFLIKGR